MTTLTSPYCFYVSKKFPAVFSHVSTKLVKAIHPDRQVANELMLVILSYLPNYSSTLEFEKPNHSNDIYSRPLYSQILKGAFQYSGVNYKDVLKALLTGTSNKGPIIRCDDSYSDVLHKCKSYSLTKPFLNKGIYQVELQTPTARQVLCRINTALHIPCEPFDNCLDLLPWFTEPVLRYDVKALIINRMRFKGKLITDRKSVYTANPDNYYFVDELVENNANTANIQPHTTVNSGGRIYTRFNLSCKPLRYLMKIEGEHLVEVDYKAEFPNIAAFLYDPFKRPISHEEIAHDLKVDVRVVKKAHLSFFNQKYSLVWHSPLRPWYESNRSELFENFRADLYANPEPKSYVYQKLAVIESQIQKQAMSILNDEGIICFYLFDAIATLPRYVKRVREVMLQTALDFGIRLQVG